MYISRCRSKEVTVGSLSVSLVLIFHSANRILGRINWEQKTLFCYCLNKLHVYIFDIGHRSLVSVSFWHPSTYALKPKQKRSTAPKQTRRILLLEVPADVQKLKEQKADGKKPYFFSYDRLRTPYKTVCWMRLHFFFNSLKGVRSHLLLTLMMTSFRYIYSLPNLHQEPKLIQQMQKHNWNIDLTNAEDDM